MMKAEPVADVTRNTHNYFAQGGNEPVSYTHLDVYKRQILHFVYNEIKSRKYAGSSKGEILRES